MSRTVQNLTSKLRARRARREFDCALQNASPALQKELYAASLRAESQL